MKKYLELMRIKHWIKNIFIFIPIVFSRRIFEFDFFWDGLKTFILFSVGSSLIYIINDICDVEKDKRFGIFTRNPEREEVVIPVEERFIVELYSK